jgi:hypothetical protein
MCCLFSDLVMYFYRFSIGCLAKAQHCDAVERSVATGDAMENLSSSPQNKFKIILQQK